MAAEPRYSPWRTGAQASPNAVSNIQNGDQALILWASAPRGLWDRGHIDLEQLIWPFSCSPDSSQQVSNSLQKQVREKLPHADSDPHIPEERLSWK